MLCCLFAALLLCPFGLRAVPRAGKSRVPDCCTNRGAMLAASALALVVLGSAVILTGWLQPAPFRHICGLLAL